jgi:hypothetical protein
VTALWAAFKPEGSFGNLAFQVAGWLAIVFGLIGFAFHHYYGIAKKPGGYSWLLHYLMYGAPPLAPLALTITGMLALMTARGLAGEVTFAGLDLRAALLTVVVLALAGATLQAAILHYRGAFNNPLMFVPLTVPLIAIGMSIWMLIRPTRIVLLVVPMLLWMTFLMGFVGLGMHLRGFGRQMGGLYLSIFNWLEGPPAFAPAVFTGFAVVGLIAIYFL